METVNNNHVYERLVNYLLDDDFLLFHYTSLDSACKILETNSLKLSNLTNTNDPLEFIAGGSFSYNGWGEMDQLVKIARELSISGRRRQNFIRMICFCMDNYCSADDWKDEKKQTYTTNLLDKGWARCRMWAQYADNHNGVCFVFSKNEFSKQFETLKEQSNNIKILPSKKIFYSNDLSDLERTMSELNENHDLLKDHSDFYLMDDKLPYLFQKCEDYRDENEYRYCLINKDLTSPDEAMFVPLGNSLKAIIYGQRFSRILKLEVPETVEQYLIQWSFGIPRLIPLKTGSKK